jgi:hypothetical protein
MCRHYGALWAYPDAGQVNVLKMTDRGVTETYVWGDRVDRLPPEAGKAGQQQVGPVSPILPPALPTGAWSFAPYLQPSVS